MAKGISFITLVLCIIVPLGLGTLSGVLTSKTDGWYDLLVKPSFNPPGYLFGIVWPILYILMGISLYLVWQAKSDPLRNTALYVFSIQIILNFLWSFVFFRFHQIGWALAEIILLWFSILTMLLVFLKINKTAGLLQIPYLVWVTFATVLNLFFLILNKK